MEKKIWDKFHPLFGPDLKVGFETTFPRETAVILDSWYAQNGLIHNNPKETVKRISEPAVGVWGSCLDGITAQVRFRPISDKGALFRKLVFARKIDNHSRAPRRWMVAARHGEVSSFGFDSWNSKSQRYLSLAYTGPLEQFVPVYFKIRVRNEGKKSVEEKFIYLQILAVDDEETVLVQARRIREVETPEQLRPANPELIFNLT